MTKATNQSTNPKNYTYQLFSTTKTTTNQFNTNTNNEDKQMTKATNQSTNTNNCTN